MSFDKHHVGPHEGVGRRHTALDYRLPPTASHKASGSLAQRPISSLTAAGSALLRLAPRLLVSRSRASESVRTSKGKQVRVLSRG
jgi:hypothetical protein